jgi:hypothetical protein
MLENAVVNMGHGGKPLHEIAPRARRAVVLQHLAERVACEEGVDRGARGAYAKRADRAVMTEPGNEVSGFVVELAGQAFMKKKHIDPRPPQGSQ